MIVLDTGGLLAALDANEELHGRCVAALVAAKPPRVLSPFVLAELDYLIGARVGHDAQMALLEEVGRRAYQLDPFAAEDVERARQLVSARRGPRCGVPRPRPTDQVGGGHSAG
jgi:predicted nucleic acid-binding protein